MQQGKQKSWCHVRARPSSRGVRSRSSCLICRLMLPGLRMQDTDNRMCRSFRICHNSKGAAWTTVQVFSALEPLLTQLKLDPATEYVEVKPLQGCLTSGCCCSTPVEVRFSLPIHRDKATAAAELADVNQFLRFRLPRELQGTACTSGSVTECPPVIATERKLLRCVQANQGFAVMSAVAVAISSSRGNCGCDSC